MGAGAAMLVAVAAGVAVTALVALGNAPVGVDVRPGVAVPVTRGKSEGAIANWRCAGTPTAIVVRRPMSK